MSKKLIPRVLGVFALVLLIVVSVGARQHFHYQDERRAALQDRQPLFYGGDVFHVVTYLELAEGQDLIARLRSFKQITEELGATWINAGQVATNGVVSTQLGDSNWSAVVLLQYPSRAVYDEAAASSGYRKALAGFDRQYSHGMRRGVSANLLLPQRMLQRRVSAALWGPDSPRPFTPADTVRPHHRLMIKNMLGQDDPAGKPAVVYNLQLTGNPEQQAANARYAEPMTAMMGRGGFGPFHVGPAEAVEGSLNFDSILIAAYPSLQFFADMIGSGFYQGIYHDKQLGDTQATVTFPILDQLR